jgi:NAD(P)H dehydrogenase (quinone)
MKRLEKGLALCSAGNTMEHFRKTRLLQSMEQIMLGDRLVDRVKTRELVILEDVSLESPRREENMKRHLDRVFSLARHF